MAGVTEAQSSQRLEWLIEETSAAMAVYDVSEEIHKLALELRRAAQNTRIRQMSCRSPRSSVS
jgi:uncharacterized phage-like protein YoqJ